MIKTIKGAPQILNLQRPSSPETKLPCELKLFDISEHKPSTGLACWAQKLQQQRLWKKHDVLVNDDEDDVDEFSAAFFDLPWNTAYKVAQSTNVNGDYKDYYGDTQGRAWEAPAYPQSLYPWVELRSSPTFRNDMNLSEHLICCHRHHYQCRVK